MNTYFFEVTLCGGTECGGHITVEAENQDTATTLAQDSFVNRWCDTFPELDVDYDVHCTKVIINTDDIEAKIAKAYELLPSGEALEINSDGYAAYALRYNEARGSAEPIDGMKEPLWYVEDEWIDNNFNPREFIDKYPDCYVCGI